MKPTLIQAAIRASLLFVGACAAGMAQAQTSYTFIDLGSGSAAAINDLGQVVGTSNLGATLWNNGTAIGLTGGQGGAADAINNLGQIVGNTSSNGVATAALWNGSSLTHLSNPSGGNSYAYGINDAGQIAGGFLNPANVTAGATLWQSATASPTVLSTSNGQIGAAYGINIGGQVAGYAYYPSTRSDLGTVWSGGSTTFLQPLSSDFYSYANATAINNLGTAVGFSNAAPRSGDNYAVEWVNGHTYGLGGFNQTDTSEALAINNNSVIAGNIGANSGNPYSTAVIWNITTPTNLNNYLTPAERQAGWVLTSATGINDQGSIVGDAFNTKTGASDAFELKVSPVPEPGEAGMMLAGLGLIGMLAWRKRGARQTAC